MSNISSAPEERWVLVDRELNQIDVGGYTHRVQGRTLSRLMLHPLLYLGQERGRRFASGTNVSADGGRWRIRFVGDVDRVGLRGLAGFFGSFSYARENTDWDRIKEIVERERREKTRSSTRSDDPVKLIHP